MALANFFNKAALSASHVLRGYDTDEFKKILLSHRVQIFFEHKASQSMEAIAAVDLLTRMLARLYPFLLITGDEKVRLHLKELARQINPDIEEFHPDSATVTITVGISTQFSYGKQFYIGSDAWIARFSDSKSLQSGNSGNPFGAGAAACFGAANIFRYIFSEQLPYGFTDKEIDISLWDFKYEGDANNPQIPDLYLKETLVVGLGAIGNGLIWTLGHFSKMQGEIILVDQEIVDLSNLQRYVISTQNDVNGSKLAMSGEFLKSTAFQVRTESCKLEEYMNKRNNWQIRRLAICVDNAQDRIMAQGVLPEIIFNAWTQRENLGVSRHFCFNDKDACLACLYYPVVPKKSLSQEVADNLNLSQQELRIRHYLANNLPVDQGLINDIAIANSIVQEKLIPFIGKPMSVFYSEFVCGGVLLSLNTKTEGLQKDFSVEVPAAFESAFAGILLTAELIREAMGVKPDYSTTQFNMLRPLTAYISSNTDKKADCICSDPIFNAAYANKWMAQTAMTW